MNVLNHLHNYSHSLYEDVINTSITPRSRVHDWRNYVPDEIREVWEYLSIESRLVIAIIANHISEQEEWK